MRKQRGVGQGVLFDAAAPDAFRAPHELAGDVPDEAAEVATVFSAGASVSSAGAACSAGSACAEPVLSEPGCAETVCAGPALGARGGVDPEPVPFGLVGRISLGAADCLGAEEAAEALELLHALIGWAQAQQARVVRRIEVLASREVDERGRVSEELQAGEAMTLAAAEVGALLRLPHMTAMRVVSESGALVDRFPVTLAGLSRGKISYSHARVVLDEASCVSEEETRDFEAAVLDAAEGRTAAQLGRRVRTMRERRHPETVAERHRKALEDRRVWLDPAKDGMSCLTALMPAEQGQATFDALTRAGRAVKNTGDARTLTQLRVDLLGQAVLGRRTAEESGGEPKGSAPQPAGTAAPHDDRAETGVPVAPAPRRASSEADRGRATSERDGAYTAVFGSADSAAGDVRAPGRGPFGTDGAGTAVFGSADSADGGEDSLPPGVRAEVMVIIDAETLLGGDERPAELNGYGPISAEAARRLIRQVRYWTGLIRNPQTGEIMAVGRRRKIPAGLARWLQARDGTCRFPGCSVSAARAEVDHTVPWSAGGPTDHRNLEHLCPKHRRLKCQGYWRAEQPEPGVVRWRSLFGREYTTEPQLALQSLGAPPG